MIINENRNIIPFSSAVTSPVHSSFVPEHPKLHVYSVKKENKTDSFLANIRPLNKTFSEIALSNTQDKLFLNLYPEKFILKYANKEFLTKAIKNNPNIEKMLKAEGLKVKIEPENVISIMKSHLIPTMKYAKMIMENSGEFFSAKEYEIMMEAALLHDIGKALIPSEILNKKGALTAREKEIVKLHNDLGYEILKSTNLSPRVLSLVQNHHGYGNVYPKNSLTQILTTADIYSALKESRPYRPAMSDKKAFEILKQGVDAGDFSINYVNALKNIIVKQKQKEVVKV